MSRRQNGSHLLGPVARCWTIVSFNWVAAMTNVAVRTSVLTGPAAAATTAAATTTVAGAKTESATLTATTTTAVMKKQ